MKTIEKIREEIRKIPKSQQAQHTSVKRVLNDILDLLDPVKEKIIVTKDENMTLNEILIKIKEKTTNETKPSLGKQDKVG